MNGYTVRDFNRDFPDDQARLEAVVGLVYPEEVVCRSCGQIRKHHSVSAEHVQSPVNEYAFRYNHRADERNMSKVLSDRVAQVPHGRHAANSPVDRKAPRGGNDAE